MATGTLTVQGGGNLTINDLATVSSSLPVSFGPVTAFRWHKIVDLQITLGGLTHTFPDDLDFLIVGPDGRAFELWSDAGFTFDINNGWSATGRGSANRCVRQRYRRDGARKFRFEQTEK